jgi:peptidoglycan/xylan/chitin deacetylase (PgdA/CDA1 family)
MSKHGIKHFIAVTFGNRLCVSAIRYLNRRKLRILCYHRITRSGEAGHTRDKNMCTRSEAFEEQMKYLRESSHPVGEAEIISAIENGSALPAHPVWVTFDDGYKDNYTTAYPILRKFNIPATFFITTGFINLEVVPAEAAAALDAGRLANPFMSWEEIADLKRNGHSIGAHTATHRILSAISASEAENEIRDSKKEIEQRIQGKIHAFAYPHGKRPDIDFGIHPKMLQSCGFKLAVTTLGGPNSMDVKGNHLLLRRMGISYEDNLNIFQFKLSTGCPWQR